jgi:plasmid stabilization system protein ParE
VKSARITKKAQQDLEQIRALIAKDNPNAAAQVWGALLDTPMFDGL